LVGTDSPEDFPILRLTLLCNVKKKTVYIRIREQGRGRIQRRMPCPVLLEGVEGDGDEVLAADELADGREDEEKRILLSRV
jgi:hypothetical protein